MFKFPMNESGRALQIVNKPVRPHAIDEWANVLGWLALIATFAVVFSSVAKAEPIFYHVKGGKIEQVAKIEAMLQLAKNPNQAQILKCHEQELTPKATLKNKKVRK
jgi:hypothetical protein